MVSKKQQAQIDAIENMDATKALLEQTQKIVENTSDNDAQLNVDNLFSEMLNVENENAQQKIVSEIVNADNLELKTEINKVSETTVLTMFQQYLDQNRLVKSSNTLERYINTLFRYSVSKNRKSREELIRIVEALSASIQQNETNQKFNLIS